MRTFLIDGNNDLTLGKGRNVEIVHGPGAVAMVAKAAMLTRRTECIHAAQRGMPYDTLTWAAAPNLAQFEAAGRAILSAVPGVVEVVSFVARKSGEDIFYSAALRTIYNEVVEING